jgi:hypothetical protein
LISQSDLVPVMYFLLVLTFLTQPEFHIKTKWILTIFIFTQKSPHQHDFIFAPKFAPNFASRSYTYVNCPLAPKQVTLFLRCYTTHFSYKNLMYFNHSDFKKKSPQEISFYVCHTSAAKRSCCVIFVARLQWF